MEKALLKIAELFNKNNIRYGVGGSLLLNHYGLIDRVNDVDIIVDKDDIKLANELLLMIAKKKDPTINDGFATTFFYQYELETIDIDIMADFKIIHVEGVYTYPFDEFSITNTIFKNNIRISYSALEDWYVIYHLLNNRKNKVKLIDDYLMANDVNRFLLRRALHQPLPKQVKDCIQALL